MNGAPPRGRAPARPGAAIGWLVPAAVVATYLAGRLVGGGPWRAPGGGVLGFGTVDPSTLERFGAAIPWRIANGEWQRLVLDGWLTTNLLSVLLGALFLRSTTLGAASTFGAGGTLFLLVAGSVAANTTDAIVRDGQHASLALGWFAGVLAVTGAELAVGLFGRAHPQRVACRRAAIGRIVMLVVFDVIFTWDARRGGAGSAELGDFAMLAALGAGAVFAPLLGLMRGPPPPAIARALFAFAIAVIAAAVVRQVARAEAERERPSAARVLSDLVAMERRARRVWDDGHRATGDARTALGTARHRLRERAQELVPEAGRDAWASYLDAFEPLITGDVPDPGGVRARLRITARRWIDEGEAPWRRAVGLPPRAAVDGRTWEKP